MDKKVDFVGLQETMRQNFSRTDLQKLCAGGDFHWHHTPSKGKSGGLLLGVNYTTLDVISQEEGEYYIKMTVQDVKSKVMWDLVLVYGEAQMIRKARFLAELARVLQHKVNPILIGGILILLGNPLKKTNLDHQVIGALCSMTSLNNQI